MTSDGFVLVDVVGGGADVVVVVVGVGLVVDGVVLVACCDVLGGG
jgi:hypothetical protein